VLQRRLAPLRLGEGQPAGADGVVQLVLGRVDVVGPGPWLRPEVARVARAAAELEADQVILLVIVRAAGRAVLPQLPQLQLVRVAGRGPHRLRPAAHADRRADRRLRDVGVQHARRPHRVGEEGRPLAAAAARPEDGDREHERGDGEQLERTP
jgi:hypothetical protein